MDGWKTFSFPFGMAIFAGAMLVSGRVTCPLKRDYFKRIQARKDIFQPLIFQIIQMKS